MISVPTQRVIFRWIHLVLAIPIIGYIYSPFEELPNYAPIVRFIAFPVIAVTGLWMWKGHWLRSLFSKQKLIFRWIITITSFISTAHILPSDRSTNGANRVICCSKVKVYSYEEDRKDQYGSTHSPMSIEDFLIYAEMNQISIPDQFLQKLHKASQYRNPKTQ